MGEHMRPFIWIAALAGFVLHAQGTTPREKPADYQAHSKLPGFELAADYLSHSMPVKGGVIDVNDYLVIEVAIFPSARETPSLTSGEFTLRITNHTRGRKSVLSAQTPGMVAASLKYPDWEVRPTVEATAGVGDTGVILGRPVPTERFPGDPRPQQSRLPPRPKVSDQTSPSGEAQPPEAPLEETVQRSAFPEGTVHGSVSGYLFFPFHGKTKSIRSLELVYESQDGSRKTTLALF
jgi:hypothetical protein